MATTVMSQAARIRTSERTRDLAEQSDRHAMTLESLLAVLRSPRLGDDAARQTAIDVAAAALVQIRTASDVRESDLLEPVVGAFERLKSDLRPLVRFGRLDVQFVEPPANGRALPGTVALSARAIVRHAVLAFADVGEARRVRIQWDCDGLNLLIGIRDDGAGDLDAHDDSLRSITEQVSANDGTFRVSSTPGWGSDLTIVLPLDPPPAPAHAADEMDLSGRELQILRLLSTGARNAEIAAELRVSPHTVKFYVSKLLRKTGARNRAELAGLPRVSLDL